MGKFRDTFFNISNGLASAIPLKMLQNASGTKAIFPFYHIVSDVKEPHISNLYAYKNSKQFEQDLDFLLKHFKPLTFTQVQEYSIEPKKYDYPSFFLSFDDGLKQFYDVIAPILLRKGIEAACFLNSAFIDNKALFFRYKSSLLIEELTIKKPSANTITEIKNKFKQHGFQEDNIIKNLLAVKYNNAFILDEIAELLNYDFNDFLQKNKPYLTSQQIEELIKQGFIFGAHSIDHPEYRFLNLEDQLFQTEQSIEKIKTKFNLSYSIFSFPFTDFGVSDEFFVQVLGNNWADITFGCAGIKKEIYSRHIQRLSMEQANLTAEQIIKTEMLYNSMRRMAGKHKIIRK